jgi:hypothetical protein
MSSLGKEGGENMGDERKKRKAPPRTDSEGVEKPTKQQLAQMTRTEKKAHREKRRRSEVNKGMEELSSLLLEIDPSIASSHSTSKGDGAGQMNRITLLNKTVEVLRSLHKENKKLKSKLKKLDQKKEKPGGGDTAGEQGERGERAGESEGEHTSSGSGSSSDKQVMMVMPYLQPVPIEEAGSHEVNPSHIPQPVQPTPPPYHPLPGASSSQHHPQEAGYYNPASHNFLDPRQHHHFLLQPFHDPWQQYHDPRRQQYHHQGSGGYHDPQNSREHENGQDRHTDF